MNILKYVKNNVVFVDKGEIVGKIIFCKKCGVHHFVPRDFGFGKVTLREIAKELGRRDKDLK